MAPSPSWIKGHLDDVMNFIAVHIALSAENKPLPSHTVACGAGISSATGSWMSIWRKGRPPLGPPKRERTPCWPPAPPH